MASFNFGSTVRVQPFVRRASSLPIPTPARARLSPLHASLSHYLRHHAGGLHLVQRLRRRRRPCETGEHATVWNHHPAVWRQCTCFWSSFLPKSVCFTFCEATCVHAADAAANDDSTRWSLAVHHALHGSNLCWFTLLWCRHVWRVQRSSTCTLLLLHIAACAATALHVWCSARLQPFPVWGCDTCTFPFWL